MKRLIHKIQTNKKVFAAVICILIAIIIACMAGAVFMINRLVEDKPDGVVFTADFNSGKNGFRENAYVASDAVFSYEKDGGIDGSGCVKVENIKANDARYEIDIEVEKNSYYKISGWVRTENIVAMGDAAGANISVIGNFSDYEYIFGTQDWYRIEYYGKTASDQDVITLALRVGFYSGDNTGSAWFDNIEVARVSKLPDGVDALDLKKTLGQASSEDTETEDDILDEFAYKDITKAVVIMTVFILLMFIIAYRYARAYDGFKRETPLEPPCGKAISLREGVFFIFVIGILIRLILAFTPIQCSVDVNIFKYWGNMSFSEGFTNTYITLENSIDYPPLYVYCLYLAAAIKSVCGFLGEYQNIFYSFLIKLTPIIADCLIGVFVYKICDKKMRAEWTCLLVAAWILNPLVIIDSACWGQVDSVLALFVLLSVYFVANGQYWRSGLMLGFGLMLKPQAIIVAPIIFFVLFKNLIKGKEVFSKRILAPLKTLGGFVIGAVTPCLPFMFKMGFKTIELFGSSVKVPWILSLFAGTANHYDYASVNALNFWYALGKNWVKDSEMLGALSIFMWGMIAIVVICVFVWIVYMLDKNKPQMPYFLAAALYMGVSMFGPRMHERYFFTALIFLLAAFILSNNKINMWLYTAMSTFGFLTVAEVLLDLEVGKAIKDSQGDSAYNTYAKYLWVSETLYRLILSYAMVAISIALFVFAVIFVTKRKFVKSPALKVWKLDGDKEKFDDFSDAPLLSLDYTDTAEIAVEVTENKEAEEAPTEAIDGEFTGSSEMLDNIAKLNSQEVEQDAETEEAENAEIETEVKTEEPSEETNAENEEISEDTADETAEVDNETKGEEGAENE